MMNRRPSRSAPRTLSCVLPLIALLGLAAAVPTNAGCAFARSVARTPAIEALLIELGNAGCVAATGSLDIDEVAKACPALSRAAIEALLSYQAAGVQRAAARRAAADRGSARDAGTD